MTVGEVLERLRAIQDAAEDDEAAHSLEDALHQEVLEFIAAGEWTEDDPLAVRDLARAALGSRRIEFARWCA